MEGWGRGGRGKNERIVDLNLSIYQLLLSGVLDTKCGCFTFTFFIGEEELKSTLVGRTSHALNTSFKD